MNLDAARTIDENNDPDDAALIAFRKFVHELAGTVDDNDVGTVEATFIAIENYHEMAATVDELEAMMPALVDNVSPKVARARDIVEYALGGNPSGKGVVLSAKEVARAADVSLSYAYRLMDDDGLPDDFEFFLTRQQARERQYGSVELDADEYSAALVVDLDDARASPFALNKFNNPRGQGVAE